MVRVSLSLSHLLQSEYFLICPLCRIAQLASGFLTEGTAPGAAAIQCAHGRKKTQGPSMSPSWAQIKGYSFELT